MHPGPGLSPAQTTLCFLPSCTDKAPRAQTRARLSSGTSRDSIFPTKAMNCHGGVSFSPLLPPCIDVCGFIGKSGSEWQWPRLWEQAGAAVLHVTANHNSAWDKFRTKVTSFHCFHWTPAMRNDIWIWALWNPGVYFVLCCWALRLLWHPGEHNEPSNTFLNKNSHSCCLFCSTHWNLSLS